MFPQIPSYFPSHKVLPHVVVTPAAWYFFERSQKPKKRKKNLSNTNLGSWRKFEEE